MQAAAVALCSVDLLPFGSSMAKVRRVS